ncbi:hypothetical protein DB35_10795 [Streptomyces abyssalis]|uniref:Uncharacterized protein n=2 Tax=Streptomyces abyssalis TaxID=933944 RepID=A0A1E7JIW3_9ACTN|nr:hypothetical protein AN215_27105 [Streptomyces abyssalis]OEU93223.1 hypothetical protein DB35_10795 [Streptomyces abyssalis]
MRASLAAHEMWSNCPDRSARTARARAAFLDRFEDEVDPDRQLSAEERKLRAGSAMKAHFARLSLLSSRARAKRKGSQAS